MSEKEKRSELRNEIITGTFDIGHDGLKHPTSWEDYAIKLEDKILLTDRTINQIHLKAIRSKEQYNSIRLAVLEYLNTGGYNRPIVPHDGLPKPLLELALSAGIEFKNGTWILKEGEK